MEKDGRCVWHGAAQLQAVYTHSDNSVPSLASLGQYPQTLPNVLLPLQGTPSPPPGWFGPCCRW